MDKFNQGLLSLMQNPSVQMGVGLLGRTDMSTGEAMGGAMRDMMNYQAANQAYQINEHNIARQKEEEEAAKRRAQLQAQWMQQQGFGPGTPEWAARAQYESQFRKPTEAPSNVREWQYFSSLPPAQQEQYIRMKRAQQYLDTGMQHVAPNPANPSGAPVAVFSKTLKPGEQPAVRGAQAQAAAAGKVVGEQTAEAQMGLGQAVEEANNMVSLIDQMIEHPGLVYAVGASSALPVIPGTPAADFMAMQKQMEGKTFLQAFESLKGGGHITEVEGQKATEAMTRLSRTQTEEGYRNALREFRAIVMRGMQRAKAKAGRGTQSPMQSSAQGGFKILE